VGKIESSGTSNFGKCNLFIANFGMSQERHIAEKMATQDAVVQH